MVDPKTKIAVVILSYNHPGITKQCVESALNFFEPLKLFLVHNGSRQENTDSLKVLFPKIKHLEFSDNKGFSGGANRGINFAFENSETENILFLSNDIKITRWNFISPKSTNFLMAPRIELRDTGRVASLGGSVSLWRGKLSHLTEAKEELGDFYVPGAAFMVSRKAWFLLQGFDENLGSYWEDVDLSLRAKKLNIELGITKDVILKHGVAKTTGGDPFYTLYSLHKNRKRVVYRHGHGFQRFLFSFVYTAETLRKLFKFIQKRDLKRVKLLLKATVS